MVSTNITILIQKVVVLVLVLVGVPVGVPAVVGSQLSIK